MTIAWLLGIIYFVVRTFTSNKYSLLDAFVFLLSVSPFAFIPDSLPGDFYYYRTVYYNMTTLSWFAHGWAPGYNFTTYALGRIFDYDFLGLQFVRLLPTVLLTLSIVKFNLKPFVVLFLLSSLILVPALVITRAYYANIFFLIGCCYYLKEKLFHAIFFSVSACLFHFSAIVTLPFFLIPLFSFKRSKFRKGVKVMALLFSLLILYTLIQIIPFFLDKFYERVAAMTLKIPIRILALLTIFIILYFSSKSIRRIVREIPIAVRFFSFAIILISLISYGVSRIFMYVQIFFILRLAQSESLLANKNMRILMIIYAILSCLFFLNFYDAGFD